MAVDLRRIVGASERFSNTGNPHRRAIRLISAGERREEARAFLDNYCRDNGLSRSQRNRRWAEIRRELAAAKFYRHTPEELAYGARLAWRNHGRCIGRLFWESLEVIDCRHLIEPHEIAAQMHNHMRDALGDGRIRSTISVFSSVEGDRIPARIESSQITQYAGYRQGGGVVLGDRQNVEATKTAISMGWQPPGKPSRFDLLPLFIRDASDRRSVHRIPGDAWRSVPISHPTFTSFEDLGLSWYAVPCVSNMIMTIGGLDYPCAPFSGFYMATEIASRNFADKTRYDLLPEIATAMDLKTSDDPFWRDTCLTELNRAVLHSYKKARITILDHHTACRQFMEFYHRETAQGRYVSGDWRWLVPPQSSGISDVFHLRIKNNHDVPNFYQSRAADGRFLMPFYGNTYRSRLKRNWNRIVRRWKLWKRMPW